MRDWTRIIALGALSLLVAAAVSGCSSEQEELEQWVAQVKKRPGGRIEPLPEIKPYETFAYNAGDQRSPFSMASPAGPGGSLRPDAKRNREFLEQFSLDTLSMVGTLKLGGRYFGLVQTKDGLVHRVQPGQYMGQNDGKITVVSDSKISLVEIVPDGMGGYMERTAAIGLTD